MIAYEDCGVKLTVPYHVKDLEGGSFPQAGDKVILMRFGIILNAIVFLTTHHYFMQYSKFMKRYK